MSKSKKNVTVILTIVIAIAAIIVLSSSLYTVAENEYACTVRFSKIIETVSDAGLHFKIPFIDSVKYFPRTIMLYDIPPSEVLTADQKNMTVDSYVLWRITDPLTFYKTLGSISTAEVRLDALTYNALKNLMGTLYQSDIINEDDGDERNDIYRSIASGVREPAVTYGIDIIDVKIKRFDLPEDNEQAVYARMISERNQMAEKYTAEGELEASLITNDTDKSVNIIISDAQAEAAAIEAEGEAEYMRMLAEAYDTDDKKDFFEFKLALDALTASLDGSETTIILDGNSALGRLLVDFE